jgi:hypothetical protein
MSSNLRWRPLSYKPANFGFNFEQVGLLTIVQANDAINQTVMSRSLRRNAANDSFLTTCPPYLSPDFPSTGWPLQVRSRQSGRLFARRIPATQLDHRASHQQNLKRNPDRRVVAGRVKSPMAASGHSSSQNLDLADWPVWRNVTGGNGSKRDLNPHANRTLCVRSGLNFCN